MSKGTGLTLSYSKIGRFKRCHRKYWWNDIEKIRPKSRPAAPRLGTMGHEGIAAFFRGEDWEKAIDDCWKREMRGFPLAVEAEDERGFIKEIVGRWIGQFTCFRHPDEKLFVPPEYKFEVNIKTPAGHSTHTRLIGYLDLVIEVPGEGLWIVDNKFTKNTLDNLMRDLELDEQLDYYLWALSQLFPEKKVMGAIFNGIKMKLPAEPALLKDGTRLSKAKIETDYETYLTAIKRHGLNPDDYAEMLLFLKNQPTPFFRMEWIDRSPRELEKIGEELYWISQEFRSIQYPTRTRMARQCSWDCPYTELCLADWKGGDIEYLIDEFFERGGEGAQEQEQEQEEEETSPW